MKFKEYVAELNKILKEDESLGDLDLVSWDTNNDAGITNSIEVLKGCFCPEYFYFNDVENFDIKPEEVNSVVVYTDIFLKNL